MFSWKGRCAHILKHGSSCPIADWHYSKCCSALPSPLHERRTLSGTGVTQAPKQLPALICQINVCQRRWRGHRATVSWSVKFMIRGMVHDSPKAAEEIYISDSYSPDDHSEKKLPSDSCATKLESGFQKIVMLQNKWECGCTTSLWPHLLLQRK